MNKDWLSDRAVLFTLGFGALLTLTACQSMPTPSCSNARAAVTIAHQAVQLADRAVERACQ